MNVAPPTRTRSVTKNRALAAAYAGAHWFGIEVFEPATSNTLMAALLVHDLRGWLGAAARRRCAPMGGRGASGGARWAVAHGLRPAQRAGCRGAAGARRRPHLSGWALRAGDSPTATSGRRIG
ncbi:hypothetical protein [Arsenicicoccus piscis]|nr:hypothetical protein [Arsenicicoccus piscis]